MAETTSLNFPNMFNVAQGKVSVIEDTVSVSNRCKLLLLTQPTELYNNPDIGVGLQQYLFQYNTPNTSARVSDKIREQLQKYEPCCDIEQTRILDGLKYTGEDNQDQSTLDLTVEITTTFGSKMSIPFNDDVDFIAFND